VVLLVLSSSSSCFCCATVYHEGYGRTEQVGRLDLGIAGAVGRYRQIYSLEQQSMSLLPSIHSCRVRLIQGTKNSITVTLLRNHHWYEFRMVWKASELIWWMVLIFLVTAIWSSSEAALTHSGLACIFIIFCCATVYHGGYGRTEQCDDDHTHTHSLSLSLSSTRVCASLFQRQRAISPIHLRRVRLIQGTQKIR